jgi:hypothetical protein
VTLVDAWQGELPPRVGQIGIVERLGCDLDPVDPTTADGALTLMSYVWPEQTDRLARLRGAIDIARSEPAEVVQAGAAAFLAGLRPVDGTWLVIWHSVMWQYLDDRERSAVRTQIAQIAAEAGTSRPIAHVALEPEAAADGEFQVTVETWPDVGLGTGRRVLAVCAPHGPPVWWLPAR